MSNLFLDRSVPELVAGLESRAYSIQDLAAVTIDAVGRMEPNTLAWACFDAERLMTDAKRAQENHREPGPRRALEGMPFGAKDIFNTRAYPTQMGSPIWKDFTPGNNARVVDSLLNAGALLAGKTVTAEFAVHALNETLNPHDATRTPGTSSSGSAAAVAVGMVPFALASQTAGSITRPASFCGVWGMKPSFGMVPRTGVLKTTDSLDTIGFVAAHAQSLRRLLDCIRVKGPDYPFVYRSVDARGSHPKAQGERWRVGFVKTHTWPTATDYARRAVEELAARIAQERDFEVEELEWREELQASHEIHATIYTKSLSYYFQHEAKFSSYMSPIMASMIADGQAISTDALKAALVQQEELCDALDRLFSPYDFVISLGTSSSAPVRGEQELPDPSLIWTLGHVPAVAAPAFRCPAGLPFGPQFVSGRWNDYLLLQGIETLVDRGILPRASQPVRAHAQKLAPAA
jgi:Asp-tRNA(Asn)/Glu-tRNA(Gln) amidotransferase A subunit family amidase